MTSGIVYVSDGDVADCRSCTYIASTLLAKRGAVVSGIVVRCSHFTMKTRRGNEDNDPQRVANVVSVGTASRASTYVSLFGTVGTGYGPLRKGKGKRGFV